MGKPRSWEIQLEPGEEVELRSILNFVLERSTSIGDLKVTKSTLHKLETLGIPKGTPLILTYKEALLVKGITEAIGRPFVLMEH